VISETGAILPDTLSFTKKKKKLERKLLSAKREIGFFIQTLPYPVAIIDLNGFILEVNSFFGKLYGWKKEDIVFRYLPTVPPRLAEKSLAILKKIGKEKIIVDYSTRKLRKNRSEILVDLTLIPLYGRKKQIVAVAEISQDITEQKKALIDLEKSEKQYHLLLDNAPVLFIVIDNQEKVIFVSDYIKDLLGYEKRELLGKSIEELIRPEDCKSLRKELQTQKKIVGFSCQIKGKDGIFDFYLINASPFKDREGKAAGTIIIGHNISEDKRTLGKVIREERLEALEELTVGVAHKFNNILTIILGYIQLLLEETEEPGLEKIKKQLELVEKSASEGAKVVSELREFVRARKEAECVEVDLNETVKDVVAMAQFRWKDQTQVMGIGINTELDLGNPPPLVLNDYDLRRVLTEMIFNAVEALPEGGKIILATGREKNQAYFSLSDTGVGMSPQTKKRIFDPFFTTKGPQINGLGLSVCYGIIKKYGGTIEVKSEEGKGTTFTIRIPIHPQK